MEPPPRRLDLERDRGLTVEWADGTTTFFPVGYLRAMSPSAEARDERGQSAHSRLRVLSQAPRAGPLRAEDAELVGNYAIRIRFSDGHSTGIYSWDYLRSIAPGAHAASAPTGGSVVVRSDPDRAS